MISKLRVLFWLGIVMLFLPFFGIPNTWKTGMAILIGIGLIALSVSLRKQYRTLRSTMRTMEHTIAEQPIANPLAPQPYE